MLLCSKYTSPTSGGSLRRLSWISFRIVRWRLWRFYWHAILHDETKRGGCNLSLVVKHLLSRTSFGSPTLATREEGSSSMCWKDLLTSSGVWKYSVHLLLDCLLLVHLSSKQASSGGNVEEASACTRVLDSSYESRSDSESISLKTESTVQILLQLPFKGLSKVIWRSSYSFSK